MKKMISRLFALTMAILMLTGMCLSVGAEEFGLASADSLMGNIAEQCPQTSGYTASTSSGEESVSTKPLGIFALKLRNGANATSMGAFLVQSGGSFYILSHSIAAEYAADGWELTLMGMDGENHQAVCVAVDPNYEIAYLQANGMNDYEPLKFSRDRFDTSVTVALSYSNSNYTAAKHVEFRAYDFARFTQLSDIYYGEMDKEVSLQWLGSPVLPSKTSDKVQGICSALKDDEGKTFMGLITFEKLSLESSCALGSTPTKQEPQKQTKEPAQSKKPATKSTEPASTNNKTQEPSAEPESKLDVRVLIIGALAVAAGCYYFYNKKQEANKEKAKEELTPVEKTMCVEPPVMQNLAAEAKWTLICTGGPLQGKSFPLTGTVKMGRSNTAQIRFPDNAPGISSNHCELTVRDDCVILRDLNSSYGTFVPSGKIAPGTDHKLYAGETFALAKSSCSFRLEKAGSEGGQQKVLTVKSVDGKIYKADASGNLTFGRNPGNTVRLTGENNAVSGSHCILYREGGKVYLKDLGSTNGTFFGQNQRLKPNQAYRVGKGASFFLATPANTFTVTEE